MREIALHLLDLVENSVAAGANTVSIHVCEDIKADLLTAVVEDNGRGMDAETVRRVTDPFYTSRTTRSVGLGIPLLKEAAEACDGGLEISSTVGSGTRVSITFKYSHIDRMPLGKLEDVFLELVVCHPDTRWVFTYQVRGYMGNETFEFDSEPVRQILEDVPLSHPDVLGYLRETMEEGVSQVRLLASATN